MTRLQKLQLRQSEVRVDLGKLLDTGEKPSGRTATPKTWANSPAKFGAWRRTSGRP